MVNFRCSSDEFYLGLDDIQHEGSFEWTVTGAPATWTNWNGSSGNNVGIDCVHAFRSASWRWKAVTCNKKNSFICDCSGAYTNMRVCVYVGFVVFSFCVFFL